MQKNKQFHRCSICFDLKANLTSPTFHRELFQELIKQWLDLGNDNTSDANKPTFQHSINFRFKAKAA
jgi:hypothetical protein